MAISTPKSQEILLVMKVNAGTQTGKAWWTNVKGKYYIWSGIGLLWAVHLQYEITLIIACMLCSNIVNGSSAAWQDFDLQKMDMQDMRCLDVHMQPQVGQYRSYF